MPFLHTPVVHFKLAAVYPKTISVSEYFYMVIRLMGVLFTLFLYLNNKFTLGVQFEPQCLDVPITEVLHFLLGSGNSCGFIDFLREFQRVFPIEGGQMLFKLCKQDGSLHVLGGSGAEIVNGTIIDTVLCEGVFD